MATNDNRSGISPEFPKKLREARAKKGLTQGQISKRVGADIQRMSKYERGVLIPTTEILVRLAEVLDVNLDYLVRDADEPKISVKIRDPELLECFAEADDLPEKEREAVKLIVEAFITKHRMEEVTRGRPPRTGAVARTEQKPAA